MSFDLLNYPLAFQMPRSMSGESAWIEHIPFALTIIPLAQPRVLVELGTHHGDSYMAFCQAVEAGGGRTRCHAVDTWRGDVHTGPYDEKVFQSLKAVHDPAYAHFSNLMRTDFDSAAQEFADGVIDLLHIVG